MTFYLFIYKLIHVFFAVREKYEKDFYEQGTIVSLYKVHFKWKDREIYLCAKQLDLTHPYFVSIKDLVFEDTVKLIINPSDDDIKRDFGNADHLMIPFQSVIMIEEIIHEDESKVMPFTIVEGKTKKER